MAKFLIFFNRNYYLNKDIKLNTKLCKFNKTLKFSILTSSKPHNLAYAVIAPTRDNGVPKKPKKWLNWLFLFINLLIVAVIFIYNFIINNVKHLGDLFAIPSFWLLIIGSFVLFAIMMAVETLKILVLVRRTSGKWLFKISYKTAALGRYYDNITPFYSGGQPFQIYHLHKYGMSIDKATSVPMAKFVFYLAGVSFVAVVIIVANFLLKLPLNDVVLTIAIVAIIINLTLLLLLISFSISKTRALKLILWLVLLLHKMQLIKNINIANIKVIKFIKLFQKSMLYYGKSFQTIIAELSLSILAFILSISTPFLIYLAFNTIFHVEISSGWFEVATKAMLCILAASYFPLPGGSGAAELTFTALFLGLFPNDILFWAMLLWRIINYYSYILQGFIILTNDSINRSKQIKRQSKANLEKK